MLKLIFPKQNEQPCPRCQKERGEEPSRGRLCPAHKEKYDMFTKTATSWTSTFLMLSPETCVMYEGLDDKIMIASTKELTPARKGRLIPVRTIAAIELEDGKAGNTLRIRTHGGETLVVKNLQRKSSVKLYNRIHERIQALRAPDKE